LGLGRVRLCHALRKRRQLRAAVGPPSRALLGSGARVKVSVGVQVRVSVRVRVRARARVRVAGSGPPPGPRGASSP